MPAPLVEYYSPGSHLPMTVGATAVESGDIVELSGDRTVIPASADSKTVIGVALYDAAVGELVSVATCGVWPLTAGASGVVTQGQRVISAGGGQFKPAVDPGGTYVEADAEGYLKVVGIALEDIANNATGRVLVTIG